MTDRDVAALGPRLRKNPKDDKDFVSEYLVSFGEGLYLSVKPAGYKNWFFIFQLQGKRSRLGLGSFPAVGVSQARILAAGQNKLLALGEDPRAHRDKQKQEQKEERERPNQTVRALGERWISRAGKSWGEGHKSRQEGLLRNHVYPAIGAKHITEVSEPEVVKIVRGLIDRGFGDTAGRVRDAIKAIFDEACADGILASGLNFMRLGTVGGRIKRGFRAFPAFDSLDPEERRGKVGQFMRRARAYRGMGPVAETALRILPYLAQRNGQIRQMRWADVDFDAWEWRCPPQAMKQATSDKNDPRSLPHVVPLPRQAVELLEALMPITGDGPYVFPNQAGGNRKNRTISANTVNAAIQSLGYCTKTEITGHGWRTLMQTLTQDDLSMPKEWSDRHLAHKPKGPLGARYDRSSFLDQRHEMAQKYADFLDFLADTAGPGAPNPIVRVRRRGRWVVEGEEGKE